VKRREFIALVGGASVAWPLAARAQQSAVPVVGFLSIRSQAADKEILVSFRQALSDTGYVEGRNVAIEYRFAEGQFDQLPGMAADLVDRKVAVLVTTGAFSRQW
jgi:putative ABC transport system substrate-binding protein